MQVINKKTSNSLLFFINGTEVLEDQPDPEWTLLFYLRRKLKLTGTKYACGEGGCGACTVMVSRLQTDGSIKHTSVNSCLTRIVSLHGAAVTTVEGVGSIKTKLHPVQERLAFAHGSQCGFCTPGVIMSMYSLIRMNPIPTMKEIEDNLVGNLCRCTGYRPIIEGFRSFSAEFNECGAENCCKKENTPCVEPCSESAADTGTDRLQNEISMDFIFPPKLLVNKQEGCDLIVFRGPRITWYIPTKLDDLLEIKNLYPEAKILAGNSVVGINAKYESQPDAIQIEATKVPELNQFHVTENGLWIGAAMALSDVETRIRKVSESLPEYKARVLRSLLEMLEWFACKQIKNVASLGGNIMAASAVSSIMQVLFACEARLHLRSAESERFIVMDENFFRKDTKICIVKPNEVVMSVFIPYTKEMEFFEVYRQARRRANDASIVNAGMKVIIEEKSNKVIDLKLAFGAVAKTVIMAPKTMMALQGLSWNDELLEKTSTLLFEDLPLELNSPGGSIHYRRTLVLSFFFKFYLKVKNQLSISLNGRDCKLESNEKDTTANFLDVPIKSSQLFDEKLDPTMAPIGKPLIHSSGIKHTTGEAIYVDDMPFFADELFGVLVISQKAKAIIENIDPEEALKVDGVVRFLCHKDIKPERNITGVVLPRDEQLFVSNEVTAVGETIGLIVAKTEKAAMEGVKKLKIIYSESKPIVTIEERIKKGDDYETLEVHKGNVKNGFTEADQILEAEVRVAGQEHFYMETQACIVVPKEDGEMDIYSSTQNPTLVQKFASKALGVPANKIIVKTKRVGGAFGGKVTSPARIAAIIAIAASKVGKPVRLSIDREVDMTTTGKRHTVLGLWKVGFKNNGVITSVDANLYINAGCHCEISIQLTKKSILHFDNIYSIPNLRVSAKPCSTNTPSNTAFRGFGTPQSIFVMEDILTRVASALNMPQNKVREINMYPAENPSTFYGQPLPECTIRKCWDEVIRKSDYQRRVEDANKFNRENKYHKKGLAITATKQAVSFGSKMISQAGALVHIYLDGSVLLSHAAIEMGQGVYIKLIQIASKELGVSPENIYISETSTAVVPNTSPTAGSTGADLSGMAVLNACKTLMERLSPYQKKNPNAGWTSWVNHAYTDQIQLSATGYYKDEYVFDYNFETKCGPKAFSYFTFGAAVTEIELDVLTGDHRVLRVDIVVDAGDSLNPCVDIGQIEGAYVQGYGNYTLEELVFSPKGYLRTKGPCNYKLPTVNDIPREFNVSLLRDSPNQRAVYSSKGIGEVPCILGLSAFNAIKMAIKSTRSDNRPFRLDSPATSERIRMACEDDLTVKAKPVVKCDYEEWSVVV